MPTSSHLIDPDFIVTAKKEEGFFNVRLSFDTKSKLHIKKLYEFLSWEVGENNEKEKLRKLQFDVSSYQPDNVEGDGINRISKHEGISRNPIS